MVRRQQAIGCGDNAVAVVIGVAGKAHVKAVLIGQQGLHRVARRRVHPDLAVPVKRHEAKRRVHCVVQHRKVEPVVLGDARPVVDAGTTQGVNADPNLRVSNGGQIDHLIQIGDVGAQKIVSMGGRCP